MLPMKLPVGIEMENSIPVGLFPDYKKIDWRPYTGVVIDEYKIPRTKEVQKLLELANKSVHRETEKGSFPDIVNSMLSAQYLDPVSFSDEKIVEFAIRCVEDLIQFSAKQMQRDPQGIAMLQEEIQKVGPQKVPRLVRYLELLNLGLGESDIVELLTVRKQLEGEEAAQKFASKVVGIYALANDVFQEAIQICKKIKPINTPRGPVIAVKTDNPQFEGAANVWFRRPPVIIKQITGGNVSILLSEKLPEPLCKDTLLVLRQEELKTSKRDTDALQKSGEPPEVPVWFYYKNPHGGPPAILNSFRGVGQLMEPTKIPFQDVVERIRQELVHSDSE